MFLTLILVVSTFDSSKKSSTLTVTKAAMEPIMATTTMISINVMPACLRMVLNKSVCIMMILSLPPRTNAAPGLYSVPILKRKQLFYQEDHSSDPLALAEEKILSRFDQGLNRVLRRRFRVDPHQGLSSREPQEQPGIVLKMKLDTVDGYDTNNRFSGDALRQRLVHRLACSRF